MEIWYEFNRLPIFKNILGNICAFVKVLESHVCPSPPLGLDVMKWDLVNHFNQMCNGELLAFRSWRHSRPAIDNLQF